MRMSISLLALLICRACLSNAADSTLASRVFTDTVREVLAPADIKHERGHCYIASLHLGRAGDKRPTRSVCALMENGKPLPMPRSLHKDIREKGQGRYSHWTKTSLYFSTSDNSDPRTNGREYALVSLRRVARRTFTRRAAATFTAYAIAPQTKSPPLNRRVVLRNLDSRIAVVPTLSVKGWPDLTSADGMLASILKPGMTDEQKAIAIWQFLRDWRYHYYPAESGDEVHDPVKFINVYGYGFCDDCAKNFAALCRKAGVRARIWGLSGHVVGEAFYDRGWHMFDPDHQVFYRNAAGVVASVEELAAHPEIITKTRRDPIGSNSAGIAKLYTTTDNNRPSERDYPTNHRLAPKLLPGDEVVFDLTQHKRVHRLIYLEQPLPPVFGNGRLVRKLDLSACGKEATFQIDWPYVILGGQLRLTPASPDADVKAWISADGKKYHAVEAKRDGAALAVSLDDWFAAQKKARYSYVLRLRCEGRLIDVVRGATLTTAFQFAPRALPQVQPGGTEFVLRLRPATGAALPADWRGVEVVHEWDEALGEERPK